MEDPISTILGLSAVVLLVLANGFFVATEFALVSVRRTRIQQLASEGDRRASGVLDRLNHLDSYIAATQLGITISSLALGWIGEPAVSVVVHSIVGFLPFNIGSATTHAISFILAFSLVTALHIVIGELAPKSLALQRPEATSMAVSPWIHGFVVVFRPIIFGLNWIGNRVVMLLGIEPAGGHALVQSAEELLIAMDASLEAGFVNETAHDLVGRAFSFGEIQARHVMVPRTEVIAIPIDASLQDVMRATAETSHTRLPVYEDDTDHIVGIIKVKKLMPVFIERIGDINSSRTRKSSAVAASLSDAERSDLGDIPDTFHLRDYMVEPMLVPETLAASEVFNRMRENGSQMAVVIDEYGGTAGIVTLQDIVAQLVGRMPDSDEVEVASTTDDGVLRLDGLTGLVELREQFDIDLLGEDYDVETLGGYVFFELGRPARTGDVVTASSGHTFVVEDLDGLRVARVAVYPPQTISDASAEPLSEASLE